MASVDLHVRLQADENVDSYSIPLRHFTRLVGDQDPLGNRIAFNIEPSSASSSVEPLFSMTPHGVLSHEQIVGPLLIR